MYLRVMLLVILIPASINAQYTWVNFINRHRTSCILPDNSIVWVGTSDAGLVCRNTDTGEETVFDSDNGFIGDNIKSIVKGTDNTIWAATSEKIASYNNSIWSTHNLFGNQIISLIADKHHSVWVACEKGIARQVGDHFEMVDVFDSLRQDDEYPQNIAAGKSDSSVYIRAGIRIFCFNLDGSCRSIIKIPLSNPFDITVDMENRLFVTNIDTVGVYTNNSWTFFTSKDKNLSGGVMKFDISPQGDVWAYGIVYSMVYNNGIWEVRYKHEPGGNLITTIAPLNKDSAWIGGDTFLGYFTDNSIDLIKSNTPGKNTIKFVYSDKQGMIWTQAAGDNIIRYFNGTWDYSNSTFGSLGKGTGKMIYTAEGSYCFLQSRDVLFYGSKINGSIQNFIVGSGFVPSGVLNDLVEDNSGQIWFATTNGVVKNWSSVSYTKDNAGFASNTINALLLKKDSTLWAGGDNGTVAFFKDSSWISHNLSTSSSVTCLAEDSSHGLWIGTTEGLINKSDDKQKSYTVADGLGDNHINSLLVDKDNRVWVGTYNGLSCFENDKWTTFRRPCGIAGNFISSIVQNTDGVIWIGTDRGVSTLRINSLGIKNVKSKQNTGRKNGVYQFVSVKKNVPYNKNGNSYYLINGTKMQRSKIYKGNNAAVNNFIVKPQ